MLKHYYVSPKKRSRSQSSETSDTSDAADIFGAGDFMRRASRRTYQSGTAAAAAHEKTSSEPNVNFVASPIHFPSLSLAGHAFGEHTIPENERCPFAGDPSTPSHKKSLEARLSRARLVHAFSNAVTYGRSRLPHLPTGASFTHVYGSILNAGHMDDPSQIGLTPPVRRWNSFHSTRGECHPNKFRRERKSTSPSIV